MPTIINLHNGIESQDYTAANVRAEEAGSEWMRRLERLWPSVEQALERDICDDVACEEVEDLPRQEFLARYLERASDPVVIG